MLNRRSCLGFLVGVSGGSALVACGLGNTPSGNPNNAMPSGPPPRTTLPTKLVVTNYSSDTLPPGADIAARPERYEIGVLKFASFFGTTVIRKIVLTQKEGVNSVSLGDLENFGLTTGRGGFIALNATFAPGNKVVLQLVDPITIQTEQSIMVFFYAAVVGGLNRTLQMRIDTPQDIETQATDGLSVVVEAEKSSFPLPLSYFYVNQGGVEVELAKLSPSGIDPIPTNSSHQLLLSATVQAFGEDVEITEINVYFYFESGLTELYLGNLIVSDGSGLLVAANGSAVPTKNPRLSRTGFSYKISRDRIVQFLVYIDTNLGAKGRIVKPFIGMVIRGLESHTLIGSYQVIGYSLNVQ